MLCTQTATGYQWQRSAKRVPLSVEGFLWTPTDTEACCDLTHKRERESRWCMWCSDQWMNFKTQQTLWMSILLKHDWHLNVIKANGLSHSGALSLKEYKYSTCQDNCHGVHFAWKTSLTKMANCCLKLHKHSFMERNEPNQVLQNTSSMKHPCN